MADWEIWLDNNISPITAKWLKDDTGWNVKSAYVLEAKFLSDFDFFQMAKNHGNVIILTKDTDFSDLILRFDPPPKIMRLLSGNSDNKRLYAAVKNSIENAVVRLLLVFNKNIVEINNQHLS